MVGLACLSPHTSSCCATNHLTSNLSKSSTYRIADGNLLASRNFSTLLSCSLQWQHTYRKKASLAVTGLASQDSPRDCCLRSQPQRKFQCCPSSAGAYCPTCTVYKMTIPRRALVDAKATRPNLTCVVSHHVQAEAPQTYLRPCGIATSSVPDLKGLCSSWLTVDTASLELEDAGRDRRNFCLKVD